MPVIACPPPSELKDYLSGRLAPSQIDEIDAHLESCAVCEHAIGVLEAEPDTLVEMLRSDETDAEFSSDDATNAGPREPVSESAMDASLFEAGELASYKLIRRLGSGGMGRVYLARHTKLDKEVAIKILPRLEDCEQEFVARFQREMRAVGQLEHPAIVRATDAGEHDGVHYLVMDVIDGLDLSRVAGSFGSLDIAEACEVVRQAASGLAHAHELGIVHRDVKPSNLMLDDQGRVRILDFGLAQMDLWEKGSAEITTVGQLMGTLDYMAPEQAERGGAVDYRADLYALGATLFRLIAGRAPLAAAPDLTPLEKLRLLATHSAPKLSTLRSDVPEPLERLVGRMLDRDPSGRPASASHVAEALEPFADAQTLAPLLDRARSKQLSDASSVPAEMMSVLPATSAQLYGENTAGGRRFFWPAIACLMSGFLAFAGILFVIETLKGQLVIDSKDANVTVKLRKDGKVAKELTIEPGRQATKLWGGEYEIEIDSPSDKFTVSRDKFSILRGDIVIATITPKTTETEKTNAEPPRVTYESEADQRLDEIVYEGETLDTWLRRLKFEKSRAQRETALVAIRALAEPSLKDVVEPAIREYLPQAFSTDALGVAFDALYHVHDKSFLPIADLLSDDVPEQARGLRLSAIRDLRYDGKFSTEECDLLLSTALDVAQNADPEYVSYAWRTIDSLTRSADDNEQVARLLKQIEDAEAKSEVLAQRMRDWYWFDKVDLSGIKNYSAWNPEFRRAVMKRATSVVAESADLELRVRAWLVLDSLASCGEEVAGQDREQILSAMKRVFAESATSLQWSPKSVSVRSSDARNFSGHVLGRDDQTGETSELTVALNACRDFELAAEVRADVLALHERLADFPLGFDENHMPIELRRTEPVSHYQMRPLPSFRRKGTYYPAIAFRRTGELVGIPNALDLRMKELREADWKKYSTLAIKNLRSMEPSAATTASRCLRAGEDQQAAQALVDYMIKSPGLRTSLLNVLARVSGPHFFKNLVKVLDAAPEFAGETSLRTLTEFGCNDTEELQPILDWAEKTLADKNVSPERREATRQLMLSLLYDRSSVMQHYNSQATPYHAATRPISYQCQQAIIDLLRKHELFTDDELWLTPVFYTGAERGLGEYRYGRALRQAIAQRSVDTIANSDSVSQRVKALACLRSFLSTDEGLSQSQVKSVKDSAMKRLAGYADQFDSACEYSRLGGIYERWVAPEIAASKIRTVVVSHTYANTHANETVTILQLLKKLQATEPHSELLKNLQKQATSRITGSSPLASTRSYADWRSFNDEGDFAHLIAVMTGEMLEQDVSELLTLPLEKRKKAQLESFNQVRPGDTLAIYIEGILPMNKQPLPVMQAGTNSPVVGYPAPVHSSGEVVLPLLGRLKVTGMSILEVQELIGKTYVAKDILVTPILSVEMLSKAGSEVEIRPLSSTPIPPPEK